MLEEKPISEAAKELRKRQTEAEKRLWFKLRDQQLEGVKFRRQEPIGSFIVDFVSFEQKLIIEIDGNPHSKNETRVNDAYRTEFLRSRKFKVLRFWNSETINNLDAVVTTIKNNLALDTIT